MPIAIEASVLQRNPRISLSGLALMFAIAGTALYIQLPIVGKPYFGLTVIALGAFCSSLIRRRFISIDELAVWECLWFYWL